MVEMTTKPAGNHVEKLKSEQNNDELNPNNDQYFEIKTKIVETFDGGKALAIMTIATVYALYGEDFRLAAASKKTDVVFYILTSIALLMFTAEFLVYCICKLFYLWSFFFWLDLVAVLSLIPDIPWIWDPVLGSFTGGGSGAEEQDLTVARAGRASRAGTKAGRLVRFIRIIRLIRVVKLYKYFSKKKDDDDDEDEQESFSADLGGSKIGKELSEFTTRRVIIGVLMMLFIFPLLALDERDYSANYGIQQLAAYANETVVVSDAYKTLSINNFIAAQPSLIYLELDNSVHHNNEDLISQLRTTEIGILKVGNDTQAWVSRKDFSERSAIMNMLITTFVIILLAIGAWMFQKEAEESVVLPIERMVSFVRQLVNDPLGKLKRTSNDEQEFETALLEDTLCRLAGLLQIGFGDAGAQIISQNMDGDQLEYMIPGRKIFAIFGFCDVRHFEETLLALEEQVMRFVNSVAHIVHDTCADYDGHANKNIGNAFLLVWKFPEENDKFGVQDAIVEVKSKEDNDNDVLSIKQSAMYHPGISRLAEEAVIGYMLTIYRMATHEVLDEWRTHPQLTKTFPKYDIDMGFGLHVGWAIEGAIGSSFKIDASYLSPNVNMAARLEAATKQFGVPILISGPLYELLSPPFQALLRHLDRVTVKGSKVPLDLYTFDMKPHEVKRRGSLVFGTLEIWEQYLETKEKSMKKNAIMANQAAEKNAQRSKSKLKQASNMAKKITQTVKKEKDTLIEIDGKEKNQELWDYKTHDSMVKTITSLHRGIPEGFVDTYNEGVELYIEGDWQAARVKILEAQQLMPDDKPSKAFLQVLEEHHFQAPDNWQGYRKLVRK